jgi:hypothetical protein
MRRIKFRPAIAKAIAEENRNLQMSVEVLFVFKIKVLLWNISTYKQ